MVEAQILKEIYTIVHLIGVTLGAGGAFVSDALFMSVFKDMKINSAELRLVKVGSAMVWLGVVVLIVSGVLLFSLNPERYLTSSKFLVKMTIVGVIIVNGLYLHAKLLPLCAKHVNRNLSKSREFMKHRKTLFTSGAISFTSWVSAIILGSLRSVPLDYFPLLGIYLAILAAAIVVGNVAAPHILRSDL
ncbi:MAG: hypothetical protein Q8P99_01170 [bacterium]|nr:hypothetical protein [bacterium]